MKKFDIKDLEKRDDYLVLENKKVKIVFSTAERERSFNRNTRDGVACLNSIKKDFDVNEVLYLKQIHSNKVYIDDKEETFNEQEGDGIITNREGVAIGVFTADCVPIVIISEKRGVISTVHSGWKGTIASIAVKSIELMKAKYNVEEEELKVYIGPHIRQCCYEISEELKARFLKETGINEEELFSGRNLSMERVIEEDLLKAGVKEENIYSLGLCTSCCTEVKLHSYRKSEGSYGRLFTFAIIK